MRFNPWYMISTSLFLLSFVLSCVGSYIDGSTVNSSTGAFIWLWGVLLLVVGWIVHIIGYVNRHDF
jgi:hypothetical protein